MLYLRTLLFNLGYVITSILAGLIGVLIWPVVPYRYRWRVITLWNRFVMVWLRIACNIRFKVIDQRRTPNQQPVVVLAKHQSTWETMFLQYYLGPISIILKKELLRIPFFGWGLAAMRPIAIDRSNPKKALKEVKSKGLKRLQENINLLIFPEGTRIPLGEIGNYAGSGADIASSAKVTIVPVAHNAAQCWPHKQFLKYPGEITVVIGEEITTVDANRKALTAQVKDWIETQIQHLPLARDDGIYSREQAHKPTKSDAHGG